MKQTLTLPALLLFTSAAFAADPEPKPSAAPATPQATVTSKATVTIDVNGQKQTREIDLGKFNAGPLNINTSGGSGPAGTLIFDGANTLNVSYRRTWLGVATDELSSELRAQLPLAEGTGLLVHYVAPGSPAALAGLLKNDVLAKLDDQLLINAQQLRTLVGMKKEGDAVRLTYLRRGHEETAEAKLTMHEDSDASAAEGGESNILGKGWLGKAIGLIISGALVTDKDGNVINGTGKPTMSEAADHLEKSLRAAGVDEKSIAQTKKALLDATMTIQNATGDLPAAKGDAAREVQKAVEDAKQAVERAKREAEAAARKSAPPEQKAP